MKLKTAKYKLGEIVRHKRFGFRGVIFDVDPEYSNTEEWWNAIPLDIRPERDQPFYHLLAENEEAEYVAYVSEQNLIYDDSDLPLRNPNISRMFDRSDNGALRPKSSLAH